MRRVGCLLLFLILAVGTLIAVVVAVVGHILGIVAAPEGAAPVGILVLAIVVIVAFSAGRALRRVTSSVDDLIDAAGRVETGDYSVRVPERGTRDLRALTRAFNDMSARLGDADTRRRSFLADVAHELRTPLTVVQGQLEAILDGVYPADAEHLAPILVQTHALERLVEDLRTVALAEAGSLVLAREDTEVGSLVDDSLNAFRATADFAGVRLESGVAADLPPVPLDPARIRQVLANLLGNAIRHTPRGGVVRVSASSAAADLVVEVTDTGEGIPPELLSSVFDRFVKQPGSPGSGLGLAIARDLVVAHGGTIEAQSEPGRGTTVRFTLPLRTGS